MKNFQIANRLLTMRGYSITPTHCVFYIIICKQMHLELYECYSLNYKSVPKTINSICLKKMDFHITLGFVTCEFPKQ